MSDLNAEIDNIDQKGGVVFAVESHLLVEHIELFFFMMYSAYIDNNCCQSRCLATFPQP